MARQSKIDQVIKLTQCGWRAYEGQATAAVYDQLECEKARRGRARWFARDEQLLCIGCERNCLLAEPPRGMQPPLFTYPPPPGPPKPGFEYSPAEMLERKLLLTVPETAYVLNVSPRQVRYLIHDGRLSVTLDHPMRVPVSEVAEMVRKTGLWASETERRLDDRAGELNRG